LELKIFHLLARKKTGFLMQLKQFAFYQKKSAYLRQFLLSSEEWENNWKKGEREY